MKRLLKWILAIAFLVGTGAVWAQTNAPSITIPSFTIPLPANIAAWVAAHGVVLWLASRFLIKWLDQYQSNIWVARLLWLLEHASLNKNVMTVAQRVAGDSDNVTAQTPNGLPTAAPKSTNITG